MDPVTKSFDPSNTIDPPFALLYVGPFVSVPVRPFPLKSVHVVPVPGYEDVLPASSRSASPLVIKVGMTGALVHSVNDPVTGLGAAAECAIVAVAPCVVVTDPGKATRSVPVVPSDKPKSLVPAPNALGIT
jgi:hypothetical protein